MEKIILKAEKRIPGNTTEVKTNRKKGLTPVNVYGFGIKSENFYLNTRATEKALKSGVKVFTIEFDGKSTDVIVKEMQRHPVSWNLQHLDFLVLTKGKKVGLRIPIRYDGVPFAVKNLGGVLLLDTRSIAIECLPEFIPNEIVIDVTALKLQETIHASDVQRDNLKIISPADTLLCRVGITRAAVAANTEGEA